MMTDAPIWTGTDAGTLPWLAVAGYLVGAALCLVRARATVDSRERIFWLFAGVVMLGLGVNKQLDLQTLLTASGRQLAQDGGWYGERRAIQRDFIAGAILAIVALGLALGWFVRRLAMPVFVALAGLAMLGVFVLLRAAAFHHIDMTPEVQALSRNRHMLPELAGIGVVIAGAAWATRRRQPG